MSQPLMFSMLETVCMCVCVCVCVYRHMTLLLPEGHQGSWKQLFPCLAGTRHQKRADWGMCETWEHRDRKSRLFFGEILLQRGGETKVSSSDCIEWRFSFNFKGHYRLESPMNLSPTSFLFHVPKSNRCQEHTVCHCHARFLYFYYIFIYPKTF